MSYADTPDNQRATVAAELLLDIVAGGQPNATVKVPINCKALWILTGPQPDPTLTATGVGSGIVYPVYPFWTQDVAGQLNLCVVVFVTSETDTTVALHWASAPAGTWTVLADDGDRFTLDAAIAAATANPGTVNPLYAVQVAGTDGTDLRVLKTDATGQLLITGGAFPPVYGPPGAAPPADALLVGATDGTDLRALLADATGRLLVVEQALELCIAALNTAHPARAMLVGGSDGTNLRAVNVDGSGNVNTNDVNLRFAQGAPGGPNPAGALIVAGSDGADLRTLRTNQAGLQYVVPSAPATTASDHPPNELRVATFIIATGAAALVAPGPGLRYRIFYAQATVFAALAVTGSVAILTDGSTPFLAVAGETRGPFTTVLGPSGVPLATNTAISFTSVGGAAFDIVGSIVYTIETT